MAYAPTAFAVVASILSAGFLGGVGGALLKDDLRRQTGPNGSRSLGLDWWVLLKAVVLGVLAAFVVPLFLELAAPGADEGVVATLMSPCDTTSSNNPCSPGERWSHLLVLVGFCIVAAVWAQSFLETIRDKVLREAKEEAAKARETAETAHNESRRALVQAQEAEALMEMAQENPGGADQQLSEQAHTVLKAILDSAADNPSTKEISELATLGEEEAANTLEDLRDKGFVRRTATAGGDFWSTRGWGRRWLIDNVGLTNQDRTLLTRIADLPTRRPTPSELANSLEKPLPKIQKQVLRLKKLGLVAESTTEPGGLRLRGWAKEAVKAN